MDEATKYANTEQNDSGLPARANKSQWHKQDANNEVDEQDGVTQITKA